MSTEKEKTCGQCKFYKGIRCYLMPRGFIIVPETESCRHFQQKKNADKIRQMSNRELAELITPKVIFCNGCPVKCSEKDIPQKDKNDPFGTDVAGDVCVGRVEQWLNSEVEE